MNRSINLQLTEAQTRRHCNEHNIGISVIEPLTSGEIRLVCMSSDGAELVRRALKRKIITGDIIRTCIRSRGARL